MTTTINADTVTGGLIVTGDTSGSLALQSAGVTLVTLNGAVTAVTGSLTADSATIAGITLPTSDGNANQVMKTDGSGNLSFADNFLTPSVITDDTTAINGYHYYLDSAGITLTLPSSPSSGDRVGVSELNGDTTCVIAANGSKIMGSDSDLTIDTAYLVLQLSYTGATNGWAFS